MMPRSLLSAVLTLGLFAPTVIGLCADEPKKPDDAKKADEAPKAADPGTLIVLDGAGKEHKLKTWKFSSGIRNLEWLAAAAPDQEPADKDKGAKAPKAKGSGPEALAFREENSTAYKDGVLTLVPLDRLRAIDYDLEKEKVTARVAISAKPGEDVPLTGSTEYKGINKLAIDAEVDKGDLGLAEVHFASGGAKGIKGVRFPPPKPAAEVKDARPAALTYGDRKGKHVVNVTDLQGLYRTADGEVLSGLLFFKKTIKIDVSKLKKISARAEEGTLEEPIWGVTLKSGGDEETLTLMSTVQLDGKNGQLEGLLGRVPAGYKLFPVHLIQEIEFDVRKDEGEKKPKPDGDK
jgi:hypothetical protein